MPLSEQDGFEHGQQGIGWTAAVVSKVTGSLTIQVLVDVFGNHGLDGLLEEGAHEKSPKCLGGNLGDFEGILQRSQKEKKYYKQLFR